MTSSVSRSDRAVTYRRAKRAALGFSALSLGAVALLAACAGQGSESTADIGAYCAIRACVCEEAKPALLSKADAVDVLWNGQGKPYCETGFVLSPTTKPRTANSKYYKQ